ncbi:MAG: DNA repair and recombination protein RadA [Nitrososphaeria archaeon]|jgi:DNA repair protein RadA
MSVTVFDMELRDLEGIGPSTEKKLKDAGIESVLDLAVALPDEVADKIGGAKENASAMIFVAQKALMESGLIDKEFVPAIENYEKRKSMIRCTTGSKNLDSLLIGGVETQAITEFWGEFGSGKSQLCHTLCVTAQLPIEKGGFGGNVIFIDTESTFRPERVYQIAEARGLDPIQILKNVIICKVYNSSHLELAVKRLGKYIEQYNVKLVIVDSIISLHRAEFVGRGTLAERQQKLNGLVHRLLRMAEIYNVAVAVTNQVQAQPDTFFGDPTKPAGGHILGHACTYRVYLKKAGQERIATIIDSPYHPYSENRFVISEKGVEDPEPKKGREG